MLPWLETIGMILSPPSGACSSLGTYLGSQCIGMLSLQPKARIESRVLYRVLSAPDARTGVVSTAPKRSEGRAEGESGRACRPIREGWSPPRRSAARGERKERVERGPRACEWMRGVLCRARRMTGVVSTAPKRSEERAEGESGKSRFGANNDSYLSELSPERAAYDSLGR
jgi:hypothetical protein